jgi:predicted nucleotide-binding protein (sugar kinase/HSP70/actin superfamily)
MTIGIPRALIYWKRPQFWESFFENLGFRVLLSPKTNKGLVEEGVRVSDPENCFSTKVFFGHLLWLDGKVDWLFVPRLKTNAEKLEYCPKFFALPDLSKILVRTPILTETFDERKEPFGRTLGKLGEKIGRKKREIERAREKAFLKEKDEEKEKRQNFLKKIEEKKTRIALVSHPYNFYDDYVNLRVEEKLEKLGAQAVFIEETPVNETTNQKPEVQDKDYPKFHWEFGKEWMEKIDATLSYGITGAIEISSFQCGCDAVLKEFVEKKFKQNRIPFLYLLIDEQTGEAGLQTRLEAFIDTLH